MNPKLRLLVTVAAVAIAIAGSFAYTGHLTEAEVDNRTTDQLAHLHESIWERIVQERLERSKSVLSSISNALADIEHSELGHGQTLASLFTRLHASGALDQLHILRRDGSVIFSSSGESESYPLPRLASMAQRNQRVMQGLERYHGELMLVSVDPNSRPPDAISDAVVVVAESLRPSSAEFKLVIGVDLLIFSADSVLEQSTDTDLANRISVNLPVLGKYYRYNIETEDGDLQIIGHPLKDFAGFPVAHFITVRDTTQAANQHHQAHELATLINVLAVIGGLTVLGILIFRNFERNLAQEKGTQQKLARHIDERTQELEASNQKLAREIEERRQAEEAANKLAFYDALTELPNRTSLQKHIDRVIESGLAPGFSLLMIDLDNFSDINETLGHENGDRVLEEVSRRLRRIDTQSKTVYALGADEFAVLIEGLGSATEATDVAKLIAREMERPLPLFGLVLDIRPSIGIAVHPQHGKNFGELFQAADVALHRAKKGGSGYELYDPLLDQFDPQRLSLMGELRNAILQEELSIYFQPLVDMSRRQCTGVEALVRWQHPRLGKLSPAVFVDSAEQTGLIRPLTQWVLNAAIQQAAEWRQMGWDLNLSVNLSPRNLQDESIPKRIEQLLENWSFPRERLTLEITESAIMSDPERSLRTLTQLHSQGIKLAIDDFGTGYSSLAYLRNLPVNRLKIDKSFVSAMAVNADDAVIVRSIIELAHSLGLEVVTEGVEDRTTFDLLASYGSDFVQGFFMNRPLSADALEHWLAEAEWPVRTIEAKYRTTVTQ